jgi:hypothetical protein
MLLKLDEAEQIKDSEIFLQFIDETMSFIKEKGGDAKLTNYFFDEQIAFENNVFSFKLNVSIPLRK